MHHVSAKTECSDKFIIQGLILLKPKKACESHIISSHIAVL